MCILGMGEHTEKEGEGEKDRTPPPGSRRFDPSPPDFSYASPFKGHLCPIRATWHHLVVGPGRSPVPSCPVTSVGREALSVPPSAAGFGGVGDVPAHDLLPRGTVSDTRTLWGEPWTRGPGSRPQSPKVGVTMSESHPLCRPLSPHITRGGGGGGGGEAWPSWFCARLLRLKDRRAGGGQGQVADSDCSGASPSPITSVCDLEQERRPPAQVPRPSSPACRCAAPNNSLSLSEPQLPPP